MSHHRRYFLSCLFLTPVCVSVHNTALFADQPTGTETLYFYDALGKRPLTAADSEFLVRVRPTDAAAPEQLPRRPDSLPPAVVAEDAPPYVTKLEASLALRGLHVVRHVPRAQLVQNPDLAYALPVLYRVGSDVPLYMTDQIVVRLRSADLKPQLEAYAEAEGCDLIPCARGWNRFLLRVRDTTAKSPLDVANRLHERRDLAEYAHPDFIAPKIAHAPPVINDPFYLSHQWHLDGDVDKGAQPNSDINVETAWDTIHGADAEGVPEVRVAILDECVEKFHPDLFPNWAAGLDLDSDPPDDDPSPDAGQRHGTSCAGVAVAAGNEIGVRGTAPNCGLIGVKFFGAGFAATADGFFFCVDPDDDDDHSDGAAVLSNSWSYADGTLQPPDVVNAINFAANSGRNGLGCLVFFAAGNNDHTVNGVSALAQLPSTMAIGGTNSNGVHTEFSDVGPEIGIAAPTNDRGDDGVRFSWLDITTVDNTGTSGYNGIPENLDYTDEFGGTSSATPLAAGVAALIISQDPTMSAAQARAILQHTATRIDEPYGRFDPITGHSHRLGFGRTDAGAAVAAADAGIRWPDRVKSLNATPAGNDISLSWLAPPNDYDTSLLVRSDRPFAWSPTDDETYVVSQEVAPGVFVVHHGAATFYVDPGADNASFFYGVYPRSSANRYGFGAKAHQVRGGVVLFADNSEMADPGWTHGGLLDEWTRGVPNSANSIFGQVVVGSGPLAGLNGTRAIGGNTCWGTDLIATYDANTDAYLDTPLINLTGLAPPVILEYYDWCLLETFYDQCRVEVVDAQGNVVGTVDGDTGGDYDWTRRAYDLSDFIGQPIKVRFRITSDGIFQRDGWFIDDVRIVAPSATDAPPVANDVYAETPENTPTGFFLSATDPNLAPISYVINTLPAHGDLSDPNAGAIASVPYMLVNSGFLVQYTPDADYQGPDSFDYYADDDALASNVATVTLSIGTPLPVFSFPLDTNPGWITDGNWAYGVPQGFGGDPTSGATGPNVYGYNLNGTYDDNMPPQYLTMQPINCTGLSRVTLSFARWLGIENGSFDKATIEVSTDGVNWNTAWSYVGDDLEEDAWSQQSYNLTQFADDEPFVMIRWGMGPTDGGTNFAGWNIDDVVISAIGMSSANQPPLARSISLSTAVDTPIDITLDGEDANGDPISYVILSLPSGGTLTDPQTMMPINTTPYTLAAQSDMVHYAPLPAFAGLDSFLYRVDDGAIDSNTATVTIDVLLSAPFPLTEDFEAGPPLAPYFHTRSTNTGRIQVTSNHNPIGNYHVALDSTAESSFSLNELDLVVDLAGHSQILLRYNWQVLGDETHPLPAQWFNATEGDGVAISTDGLNWHRIADLFGDGAGYQTITIDLDAAADDAGLTYTDTFRIRFQQYDNFPIDADGITLDNIQLIQGTDDPLIATESLPTAQLGEPYGPVSLNVIAGDPPFTWTVLDIYDEIDLGASLFNPGGVAQGWFGNDVAFDYVLPFAFPFYGEMHTNVKIATDGWINFGPFVGSTWNNSEILLAFNKRIAVLWDDLRIDNGSGDIYIDESAPNQVTIRWEAVVDTTDNPCNFSATLFSDGRVQFDYGAGNTTLTPTIGVSSGDTERYVLAGYDGASTLTDADSFEMKYQTLPPGISLATDGALSGTPTLAGVFEPTFHVEDASARVDTRSIAIIVSDQVPGDFNDDGDVDGDDFEQFIICYTGDDGGPLSMFCAPGDFDGDDDIDCDDWAQFVAAFQDSSGHAPVLEPATFINALLDPEADEVFVCLADMNADDVANGADIQLYVNTYLLAP